jgi:hypothetical protein
MIDVKDLMIGNFVKKRGEILVVGKIHRDSVADKWGEICFDDEIEPIPVTKEILEEMGFEEYEDLPLEGVFYRYWDKDCKYKLDVRDFWTNSQRKWYVHVDNDVCNTIGSGEFDYVHELMNLVKVVTGLELPITKEMLV